MVLPADSAPRFPCEPNETKADALGEAAFKPDVSARFVDDVEVLMEPDGNTRPYFSNKAGGESALRLGEGMWARVEESSERAPMPGKVSVQVDPARIAARIPSGAVGIQVRDDPEVKLVRRGDFLEPPSDRDPGCFVAVDATDDEGLRRRIEVPSLHDRDASPFERPTECDCPHAHWIRASSTVCTRRAAERDESCEHEPDGGAHCVPRRQKGIRDGRR